MRLWTLHPQYLDQKGLVAVWREGLLAKHVLTHWIAEPEKPIGYRNHPQLERFKGSNAPLVAILRFLAEILAESQRRNYSFRGDKIEVPEETILIPVTSGQIEFERNHLLTKLLKRDPNAAAHLESTQKLQLHPLFFAVPGEIERWEKLPNQR